MAMKHEEIQEKQDALVEEIIDLIATGAYAGRASAKVLAEKHTVSVKTVENLVSTAARVLKSTFGEGDVVRMKIIHRVEAICFRAMSKTKLERRRVRGKPGQYEMVQVADPDFRSALTACELIGKEFGMFKQKIEVSDEGAFSGWTDKELERYAERGEVPERFRQTGAADTDATD